MSDVMATLNLHLGRDFKSSTSCLNMSALEKESLVIRTMKISSWGKERFVPSKKYCLA